MTRFVQIRVITFYFPKKKNTAQQWNIFFFEVKWKRQSWQKERKTSDCLTRIIKKKFPVGIKKNSSALSVKLFHSLVLKRGEGILRKNKNNFGENGMGSITLSPFESKTKIR